MQIKNLRYLEKAAEFISPVATMVEHHRLGSVHTAVVLSAISQVTKQKCRRESDMEWP